MKKLLMVVLSLTLAATLAVSGTIAYLTSQDGQVNVMTLGKVDIEQLEQERKPDSQGNPTTTLQGFTDYKPMVPAVGAAAWADQTNWPLPKDWEKDGHDATGYRVFDDTKLHNVVDKFISVKNIGSTDAYVRTLLAFELGKMDFSKWCNEIFYLSTNDKNGSSYTGKWIWPGNGDLSNCDVITIDNVKFVLVPVLYDGILAGGEVTEPSLKQFYLASTSTNEDLADLDGNADGRYTIYALSQAVQAAGFADAQTALDTAFNNGKPLAEAAVEWLKALTSNTFQVFTSDDLVEALESGKDVVMMNNVKIDPAGMSNAYGTTGINVKNGQAIYGNGYTLDIKGAGGTWDSGINTTGGLIRDLKVTGSFRGIFINHNSTHSEPVVLENVTLEGITYTISCDQGLNQTLQAYNSTFKGWTSFAATLGDATFTNCTFGYGNGYSYCRPYAPTTFVGCEFEAGYTLDPRAAVTFENCTLDGQPLTADNVDDLVTSTKNVTVK